ncbi:MAG: hypothetical protein A4E73_03007 [Syntrophaceae bacterium PtaU1.Bin231]|nr:MAG: hypothetical protein A4E73_03007 [Syntrophaceae bacterium PtaU1.Bin231]
MRRRFHQFRYSDGRCGSLLTNRLRSLRAVALLTFLLALLLALALLLSLAALIVLLAFLLLFLRGRRRVFQMLLDVGGRRRFDDRRRILGGDDHRLAGGDDLHFLRHVGVVAVAGALLEDCPAHAVLEKGEKIRPADAADRRRRADFIGASLAEVLDKALRLAAEEVQKVALFLPDGVGRDLQARILGDPEEVAVVERYLGLRFALDPQDIALVHGHAFPGGDGRRRTDGHVHVSLDGADFPDRRRKRRGRGKKRQEDEREYCHADVRLHKTPPPQG